MPPIALVAFALFVGWTAIHRLRPSPVSPPSQATAYDISPAPTIEQLQPLASLITTRVVVTDGVTAELTGYTGDMRVAVIVRGDAMITVDLTKAQIEHIDHEARSARFILPQPQVAQARVDHEKSRVFSIESNGLWAVIPSDAGRAELIERAMRQAQQAVFRAANEPSHIEEARARARSLICSFVSDTLGWTVDVRWIDPDGAQKRALPPAPTAFGRSGSGFGIRVSRYDRTLLFTHQGPMPHQQMGLATTEAMRSVVMCRFVTASPPVADLCARYARGPCQPGKLLMHFPAPVQTGEPQCALIC